MKIFKNEKIEILVIVGNYFGLIGRELIIFFLDECLFSYVFFFFNLSEYIFFYKYLIFICVMMIFY